MIALSKGVKSAIPGLVIHQISTARTVQTALFDG
jgi:hypothetical protein